MGTFCQFEIMQRNHFCLETWPWIRSTSVPIGDQSHLQAPSNMCSLPFHKSRFHTGLCGRLPLGLTKRRCPSSDGRDLCRDGCALFGFAEGMSEVECGVGTLEVNSDHMVLGRVSLGSWEGRDLPKLWRTQPTFSFQSLWRLDGILPSWSLWSSRIQGILPDVFEAYWALDASSPQWTAASEYKPRFEDTSLCGIYRT